MFAPFSRSCYQRRGTRASFPGRVAIEYVQSRATDPVVDQGLSEGFLVEQLSPCGVDDERSWREDFDPLPRQPPLGALGVREVKADDIGRPEQSIRISEHVIGVRGGSSRRIDVVVEHAHSEGSTIRGNTPAKAAVADHAQRLPRQFGAEKPLASPVAFQHARVGVRNLANQSKKQSPGVFRCCPDLGDPVLRVLERNDPDATSLQTIDIDVVQTSRRRDHPLQSRCGFKPRDADRQAEPDEDRCVRSQTERNEGVVFRT